MRPFAPRGNTARIFTLVSTTTHEKGVEKNWVLLSTLPHSKMNPHITSVMVEGGSPPLLWPKSSYSLNSEDVFSFDNLLMSMCNHGSLTHSDLCFALRSVCFACFIIARRSAHQTTRYVGENVENTQQIVEMKKYRQRGSRSVCREV